MIFRQMTLFALCNTITGKCNDNLTDKILLIDRITNCCVWNTAIRLLAFACVPALSYELLHVTETRLLSLLNKLLYLNACSHMPICNRYIFLRRIFSPRCVWTILHRVWFTLLTTEFMILLVHNFSLKQSKIKILNIQRL